MDQRHSATAATTASAATVRQQQQLLQQQLIQQQQQYMAAIHHHQQQHQQQQQQQRAGGITSAAVVTTTANNNNNSSNSSQQQQNNAANNNNNNTNNVMNGNNGNNNNNGGNHHQHAAAAANSNLMNNNAGSAINSTAAVAAMQQQHQQALLLQQQQAQAQQQQQPFQMPQNSPIMQQQAMLQRNSPHLAQQQAQQMRMSPQLLQQQHQAQLVAAQHQRATPSPVVMVGASGLTQQQQQQHAARHTPPLQAQQQHIIVQQQQHLHAQQQPQQQQQQAPSPLAQSGTNASGRVVHAPQFIQYARPNSAASMYQQQQLQQHQPQQPQQQQMVVQQQAQPQQQQMVVQQQSQPQQQQMVVQQQSQPQQQQMVVQQQSQPQQMTLYRQTTTQQQQPTTSQQQGQQQIVVSQQQSQQIRYACINDSSVQPQAIAGNRSLGVVAQHSQLMQTSYDGSPPQQANHAQYNVQRIFVNAPTPQQQPQQQQYAQQQNATQQTLQQAPARSFIVLPSGQQPQIVSAAAIQQQQGVAVTNNGTMQVLIANGNASINSTPAQQYVYQQPQQQLQQHGNIQGIVLGGPQSIQLAVSTSQDGVYQHQVYQPVLTTANGVQQQTAVVISASSNVPNVGVSQLQYVAQPIQTQAQQQQPAITAVSVSAPKSKSPNKSTVGGKTTKTLASLCKKAPTPTGLATTATVTPMDVTSVSNAIPIVTMSEENKDVNVDAIKNVPSPSALAAAAEHISLVDRPQLDTLLKSVDPNAVFEDETANALIKLVDEFVDDVLDSGIRLSQHRNQSRSAQSTSTNGANDYPPTHLEARDIRFVLNRQFGAALPPDFNAATIGAKALDANLRTEEGAPPTKRRAVALHDQRMAAINQAQKKN